MIDIHTHIAYSKIYPEAFLMGMLKDFFPETQDSAMDAFLTDKLKKLFFKMLQDETCDKMIDQMDAAGVHKAVLLIIDGGLSLSEPELSLDDIFKLHAKVLKAHPDRFLVLSGIDPRRKDGFTLFKRSIEEYGFHGLKLYPPMGYSMYHENLIKYYELCDTHKLPVLIHTGPSLPSLQNELANPQNIIPVARDFPGVNFILAHAGQRISEKEIQDLLVLPNIYMDISGFQGMFNKVDERMTSSMAPIFEKDFNTRILFGSDWPLFNLINPIKSNLDLLKQLFYSIYGDSNQEPLNNILYKNAERIFKVGLKI